MPVEHPADADEFAAGVTQVRQALYVTHPGAEAQLDQLPPARVIDAVALPVELNAKLYMFAELDLAERLKLVLQCLAGLHTDAEPLGPDDPRRNRRSRPASHRRTE